MVTPPIWRDLKQNYRMIGYKCTNCGYVTFPRKRRICMKCMKTPVEFEEVRGHAREDLPFGFLGERGRGGDHNVHGTEVVVVELG